MPWEGGEGGGAGMGVLPCVGTPLLSRHAIHKVAGATANPN